MSEKVLITTTESIAGYQTVETFGEVFGLTTRSRNVISSFGQSVKTLVVAKSKGTPNYRILRVTKRLTV